jgi:TMEM175 potassium channel family protein
LSKGRLEAFSDGVLAIIITIMVLELRPPDGATLEDLRGLGPVFVSYVLSFAILGIYWNNHHHLFQAVRTVDGRVLWANLLLLFWLSLFPFGTAWMGQTSFASQPVALYGVILLLAAVAYFILVRALIAIQPKDAPLAAAIGTDTKGKVSPLLYAVAVPIALVAPWISVGIYVLVALIWIVPDTRIERTIAR